MSKQQVIKKPQPVQQRHTKPESIRQTGTYGILNNRLYWLIIIFTFVVYGNSILNDYTVDDAIVITNNDYTQKGFAGIKDIMTTDLFVGFFKGNTNNVAGGRYRPLSLVTFAIEYQFLGQSPHFSHFLNILFFALCGIGIYTLIRKILGATHLKLLEHSAIPLLTTLIYIAHPLHTEAVTNIKGRDEIFSLLFSVFSTLYFIRFIDEGRKVKDIIIGTVLFFLGLLSKENSILFIVIIPMTLFYFRKATIKDYGMVMIPTIIVTAIFLFMRSKFTPSGIDASINEIMNNPFVGATKMQQYATVFYTILIYFKLLIFPHPLTSDYYFNQIPLKDFSNIGVIISGILVAGLFIIAIIQLPKKTIVSYSIFFFFIMFTLVSNFLFPIGTTMSERFMFIPSLGFCFVVAYLINMLATKGNTKPIVNKQYQDILPDWSIINNKVSLAIIFVLLVGFTGKTIARNMAWKNNTTLFFTDVLTSSNSAKINNACGGTLVDAAKDSPKTQQRLDSLNMAKPYLYKAISINPKYTEAWLILGNSFLLGDKNYDSALICLEHCLEINPHYGNALNNIKVVFNEKKDFAKESAFYEKLAAKYPDNSEFYYNAAQGYVKANIADPAIVDLKKAIAIKPDYSAAYQLIGMIYGKQKNDFDSSLVYLKKAIEIDPKNWEAYENMGVCYGVQKKFDDALAIMHKAIQLNPSYAKFYLNLGVTYNVLGKPDSGRIYLDKAFKLDPSLNHKQ